MTEATRHRIARPLRWIFAFVAYWLLFELVSFGALAFLNAHSRRQYVPIHTTSLSEQHRAALERLLTGEASYTAHSPALGWTIRPHGFSNPDNPLYTANSQGLRGDRDYAPTPPVGTIRLSSFGDSFTHGDAVYNAETWQAVLESRRPRLEVPNFGVMGYGLDQAFLRWQEEGRAYSPDVVLIGYMTENIGRHLNVFVPFYNPASIIPLAKPRFRLEQGNLTLLPNPMPDLDDYRRLLEDPEPVLERLARNDHYVSRRAHSSPLDVSAVVRLVKVVRRAMYERRAQEVAGPYDPESEAFMLTTALFDAFVADVRAAGAEPLILVFPNRIDFRQREATGTKRYQPLLDHFDDEGYEFVDLLDAFPPCDEACDLSRIVPAHFSAEGNRIIAEYLERVLVERGTLPVDSAAALLD